MDPNQPPIENNAALGPNPVVEPVPVINVTPMNIAKYLHKPSEYDGKNRTECSTFISQVRLFIGGSPAAFPTEESKVLFMTTYLRDKAFAWVEPKLAVNTDPILRDFEAFCAALQKNLGEQDIVKTMGKKLRALKQSSSVSNYRTEFENIAQYLSWGEGIFKQVFYDGLKDNVKDAIALVQDEPNELLAFQELCVRIDNRLYERRQEAKGTSVLNKTVSAITHSPKRTDSRARPPQRFQPTPARPLVTINGPGPMDLDASHTQRRFKPLTPEERQHRMMNRLCLYCGKAGHRADACPAKSKPPSRLHATLTGPMDKTKAKGPSSAGN